MKLVRFGEKGQERAGILHNSQQIYDISSFIADWNRYTLSQTSLSALKKIDLNHFPLVSNVRIGPCLGHIGKLICIGLNSKQHVKEMGLTLPENDIVFFMKATSAIHGPYDAIVYPRLAKKVDWEAEVALVVGKTCKYVSEEEAKECILGITCMNDISDRYWQFEKAGGQFSKGKSFDGFAPLGPCITTYDEIDNFATLDIKLHINGALRQHFQGSEYIYTPAQCLSYLSQLFTLEAGDVISLGSGPGNAAAWNHQFLQVGDLIEFEIDKVGKQVNKIVPEP